jgi:hypothetical protein
MQSLNQPAESLSQTPGWRRRAATLRQPLVVAAALTALGLRLFQLTNRDCRGGEIISTFGALAWNEPGCSTPNAKRVHY